MRECLVCGGEMEQLYYNARDIVKYRCKNCNKIFTFNTRIKTTNHKPIRKIMLKFTENDLNEYQRLEQLIDIKIKEVYKWYEENILKQKSGDYPDLFDIDYENHEILVSVDTHCGEAEIIHLPFELFFFKYEDELNQWKQEYFKKQEERKKKIEEEKKKEELERKRLNEEAEKRLYLELKEKYG